MRCWTYSWASSDGLRHEGELNAPDKDSAYAELRKRGIHPIRVTERIVPVVRRGLRGLRKRDMTLLAVILALGAVLASWWATSRARRTAQVPVDVAAVTSDPEMQMEMRRVLDERKQLEAECRLRFLERIEKGTLTREEANGMFRAMGMKEL